MLLWLFHRHRDWSPHGELASLSVSAREREQWQRLKRFRTTSSLALAKSFVSRTVTVFARSDAAATIYFIAQFCAASIWERRLLVFSVKFILPNCKGLRKASFTRLTKNWDAAWSASALLQSGTYTALTIFFLVFFQWFCTMTTLRDSRKAELLWTACVLVPTHLILPFEPEVCSRAHVLLEY